MRLTEYVNTKWEEMIRDWRAVMYAKTEPDYAVAWSNFKPGIVREYLDEPRHLAFSA